MRTDHAERAEQHGTCREIAQAIEALYPEDFERVLTQPTEGERFRVARLAYDGVPQYITLAWGVPCTR